MKRMFFSILIILAAGFFASCAEVPEVEDSQPPAPAAEADASNPSLFWAEPAVIQSCDDDVGRTTLHWSVPAEGRLEVHVDSPDGPLFALVNPEGSKATENWVKDGTRFYLVSEGGGEILATVTVRVTREGC